MGWQLKWPFLVRGGLETDTSCILSAFPVTSLPCPLIELAGIASSGKEPCSKTNCSCRGWQLEQSRLGTLETHVPCREGGRGSCLPDTTTASSLGLLAMQMELRAASPLSSDWDIGGVLGTHSLLLLCYSALPQPLSDPSLHIQHKGWFSCSKNKL